MIPLEVLIRPVTSDDIYEKALDVLETLKIPARSWREGGVAKSIVGMLAEVGYWGSAAVTRIVRGFFLYYAEGDYLSAHASDVYDVDRLPATFATGTVTLANAGGTPYTVGANQMIVRSSNTGARFRVTQAFTLSGNSTLDVAVSAIESGSDSSVAPAEIDEFETPLSPRVSVTNVSSIIGRGAESDDQLRKRCLLKKGSWSPFGPRDAYEFAALTAKLSDGTPTSINRVSVSRYSSLGKVRVICATPTGTPSSDELADVVAECERIARPDTVKLEVVGAVQHATSHTVTLWANGGAVSILNANAQKSLNAFYAAYPIGGISKTDGGVGYLYLDAISAVLIDSSTEVFDIDFAPGTTDTALADNEVATNTTVIDVRVR